MNDYSGKMTGPIFLSSESEWATRVLRFCETLAERYSRRPEFSATSEDILEYLISLIPDKLQMHPAGFLAVEMRSTLGAGHTLHFSVLEDDLYCDLAASALQEFVICHEAEPMAAT